MDQYEAQDFRRYLNFQEDSKQTYNFNKDGSVSKRTNIRAGQGAHLQNDVIDNILSNMQQRGTESVIRNQQLAEQKALADKKAQQMQQQQQAPQTKAPMGMNDVKQAQNGDFSWDNIKHNFSVLSDYVARPWNALSTGVKDAAQGGNFLTGVKEGITGKAHTSGEDMLASLGFDPAKGGFPEKIAQFVARGLVADSPTGGLSTPTASPELGTKIGKRLIGAGTEIAGDPLNLVGAGLGSKAIKIISKIRAGKDIAQVAHEEGVTEDIVRKMLDQYGNDPKFQREASGQIIDPNAQRLNAPQPDAPLGLNGPQGLPEPLMSRTVDGLGKDVQVNGTPQLGAPKGVKSQAELDQLLNDMQDVKSQRKAMEDAHVNDQLAPFLESQHQQAQVEQTWQTSIKQAKETAQQIKDHYGGIVLDGKSKDLINEIPPQFKAKKGVRGNDIYKFADEMGFSSADEAVQFLKKIDADSKVKLKDLGQNDGMKLTDEHIRGLEDAARKSFADSSHGKAIDSLLNDLTNIHKEHVDSGVSFDTPTSLKSVVKEHGFKDVTPKTIAKSYNQKEWYHGTGTANLTKDALDPLAGDHQGLFGHGVYLTDDPSIAHGYAKSRGKRTGSPTVYKANIKMDRVLNLEEPIPNDAKGALDKFAKPLDHHYENEIGDKNYFSNIIDEMASKGSTTEEIIQRMRSEIKDFSHEAGIPTSEFVENFQDLAIYLKEHGYDGITHTGGGRTGHDPHRVLIALDPNDIYAQTGRTNQVTSFEKHTGSLDKPVRKGEDPLQFKKTKQFKTSEKPVSYTRKMDPKELKKTKFEGSFSTKQVDSPFGDKLKITPNNDSAGFKTQKEQKGFKTTVEKKVKRGAVEVDGRKTKADQVINKMTQEPPKGKPETSPQQEFDSVRDTVDNVTTDGFVNNNFNVPTGDMKGAVDYGQHRERSAFKNAKESPIGRAWNKLIKSVLDDGVYIKVMENQLKGNSRFSSEGKTYQLFANAKGAGRQAEVDLQKKLLPIFNKVRNGKGSVVDALDYRYALHLKEIKDSNPAYTLPGNLTDADLEAIIAKHENNATYNQFNNDMNEYFKGIQDDMVSSGRWSQDQVDAMNRDYKYYLPKYRLKDLDPNTFEKAFYNDFGPMSTKNPTKTLSEGSDEPIQDPIKSLITFTQKARQSAANNRALKELDNLASLDEKGTWVSYDHKKGGTPIEFFVDGKARTAYVNKEIAEAYVRGSQFEKDSMTGFLKGFAKMQRMSITGSPAFAVRNLMRDVPQAWANSRAGLGLRDIVGSSLDLFSNGKWSEKLGKSYFKDFEESGAGMSNIWSQDSKQFRQFQNKAYKEYRKSIITVSPAELKTGKFIRGLMDGYRRSFLEKTENLAKYAEFRATRRKGGSIDQAAYNARDLMDFFKAGTFGRYVNPYASFFNTTLQGRSKFLRSFAESIADRNYKAAGRVAFRNTLTATAPSALSWWAYNSIASNKQKKMIEEAPDYLKNTYWLLPSPNRKDLIRIPKPFETASLATPFEYMLRKNAGMDQDVNAETLDWVVRNLLFDPSLNIATPLYDMARNRDSLGAEISKLGTPLKDQTDVNTSSLADVVAKGVRKVPVLGQTRLGSPKQIDHLIQGYLPVASDGMRGHIDKTLDNLGVAKKKNVPSGSVKEPLSDFITGKQFKVSGDGYRSPLVNSVYDSRDKLMGLKQVQGELKGQTKTDYDKLNKAYYDMNGLFKKIKVIANDPKLSSKEKQKQMNPLIDEQNKLARKLEKDGVYKRVRNVWK